VKKILAVILIVMMVFSIAGCSAKSVSSGSSDPAMAPDVAENYQSSDEASYDKSTEDSGLVNPSAPQPYDPIGGFVAGTSQKIIFRSDMSLETEDLDLTLTKVNDQILAVRGYIESSSISGSRDDENNPRYAAFVIRVPGNQFEAIKKAAGSWGTIISENTSSQDVTRQYIDTEARVKTLKVQEERLLALLSKAQKLDDIILLESRLSEIRLQIESFTGSLAELDSLVDYATLSLSIREVKEIAVIPQNFGERVLETIKASLEQFGQLTENGIMAIIYLLPYVLILIILALVIRRSGFLPKGFRRNGRGREDDQLKPKE